MADADNSNSGDLPASDTNSSDAAKPSESAKPISPEPNSVTTDRGSQSQKTEAQKVISGTRWVAAAQIGGQFVSLGVIACLYRLVPTSDFGLLGMILPWMFLLRLVTTQGVGIATIQSEELTDKQLSGLFWVNLALGLFASVLTLLGGWTFAKLYGASELARIGTLLSGTSFLAALGSQHWSMLEKAMRFRTTSLIRLASQVTAGGGSIGYAFWAQRSGRAGYEALVIQQYVELTVILVAVWCTIPWRPNLQFRLRELKTLLAFSGYYGTANLFFFASRNIDKVILSLVLGQSELGRQWIGLYTQAFSQMMKPVHVAVSPLTSILLPALSRAKQDQLRFTELIRRFYRFTSLLLAPTSLGIFVTAPDLFYVLGGSEWLPAGGLLSGLALAIAAQGAIDLCGSIYASKGNSRALFVSSLAKTFTLLLTLLSTAALVIQNTNQAALAETLPLRIAQAYTATVLIVSPLLVYFCIRLNRAGIKQVLFAVALPIGLAAWMGLVTWGLREILVLSEVRPSWRLACVIPTGVAFYAWLGRDLIRQSWADLFHTQE